MTSAKDQEQDKDFTALLTRFDHLAARVKRLDGFEECIDIEAQESVDAEYPNSVDIRKRLTHLEKTVMQIVTALAIKAAERSIDYNDPSGIVYACGHTNADSQKPLGIGVCWAWSCKTCGRQIYTADFENIPTGSHITRHGPHVAVMQGGKVLDPTQAPISPSTLFDLLEELRGNGALKDFQRVLDKCGFDLGRPGVDGVPGPYTISALKGWIRAFIYPLRLSFEEKPSGTTKPEPKPISGIPPTFTIVLPYARIYGTTHNDHRFLVLELHHLDELNTRVSSVLQHEHVSSLHAYLGAWLKLNEGGSKPK